MNAIPRSSAFFLASSVVTCLIIHHVALIADENLASTFIDIPVDFVEPIVNVCKRLAIAGVVDQDYAICATVVSTGDRPETLLSSRVPNLQFDGFVLDRYGFEAKVYTYGCDVAVGKGIVGKAEQQAGLSSTRVADEH